MVLKRLALVAILGILVMASCARVAIHVGSNIEREIMTELNFDEDVRVTKRVGDTVVMDEVVNFQDLDEIRGDDLDLENVTFNLNATEDGVSLTLDGNDGKDDVVISAEFNQDDSTIDIQVSE